MIIKDYVVVDNALLHPAKVREGLLSMPYYSNEEPTIPGLKTANDYNLADADKPTGKWRGYRTVDLVELDKTSVVNLLNPSFSKIFNLNVDMEAQIYGHITTQYVERKVPRKIKWHVDNACCFAGVIYLNESPPIGSGTFLKVNSKIIKIENKFNRLVFYRANILHRPGLCFGTTLHDSRLTLTIFLSSLRFLGIGNVAEPG